MVRAVCEHGSRAGTRERVVRIAGDEEEGSIAQAREASEWRVLGKG